MYPLKKGCDGQCSPIRMGSTSATQLASGPAKKGIGNYCLPDHKKNSHECLGRGPFHTNFFPGFSGQGYSNPSSSVGTFVSTEPASFRCEAHARTQLRSERNFKILEALINCIKISISSPVKSTNMYIRKSRK